MLRKKLSETYYTAGEARKVLDLTDDAFQSWVKAGKIKRVTVPGQKRGMYSRQEVDALVANIEAAIHKTRFEKATPETQQDEFDLAVLNFGEGTRRFNDVRAAFLAKNADMAYYLYDSDHIAASIDIVPVAHEAISKFEDGERGWLLGDSIEQFVPGKPLECIIIDMLTTPLVPGDKRKQYARSLLTGMGATLMSWANKGIEISCIYASGGTPDGQRILETAQFEYLGEPRPGRRIYKLDVAASQLRLLLRYKAALAAWKRKHK